VHNLSTQKQQQQQNFNINFKIYSNNPAQPTGIAELIEALILKHTSSSVHE